MRDSAVDPASRAGDLRWHARCTGRSHGVSDVTTSAAEPVEASLEIETVVLVVVELVLA
jgi:hypothetical protein